jgi:acetyl esterase/lipase
VEGTDVKRVATVLGSAFGAASTVNGYRPLSGRSISSVFAWLFGLVVSELPLQTIAVQAAALAVASQGLSSRLRRFAWLLTAVSWTGLLGLHRVGGNADVPLSAALDAGLGTDRRSASADIWRAAPQSSATAKTPGLLRMLRIYRHYAHDSDVSYGEHGTKNMLDIWRRPDLDPAGHAPVLLQVPGGAWATGNKRGQAHPLMSHLAELGWVCVSINYRLSPRATWPDHIVDVKRAIAWVRTHIADYGGDPNFVAITGGSAGGHLSSLAALTAGDPALQPGFEETDTRLQAAIPFYGVYDFTCDDDDALNPGMLPFLEKLVMKQTRADDPEPFASASPITHVKTDAPPFFVLHGRNDSFIPVTQARSFVARLREASAQPVVYGELPCAQHAFDMFGSSRAAHAAVAVEQFLAEIYTRRVPAPDRGHL